MRRDEVTGSPEPQFPHWGGRLRAADMIFRLGHAYDRKTPEETEEVSVEVDWSGVHPEITKYFAKYGEWPDEATEQRLLDGELLCEIGDGADW